MNFDIILAKKVLTIIIVKNIHYIQTALCFIKNPDIENRKYPIISFNSKLHKVHAVNQLFHTIDLFHIFQNKYITINLCDEI